MDIFDVLKEYLADYEFRFDCGGGHVPSESEQVMLEDFVCGFIGSLEEEGWKISKPTLT